METNDRGVRAADDIPEASETVSLPADGNLLLRLANNFISDEREAADDSVVKVM